MHRSTERCSPLEVLGVLGQVGVDLGEHQGVGVPHQDRDPERVHAALQHPRRPGVPEVVEGVLPPVPAGEPDEC